MKTLVILMVLVTGWTMAVTLGLVSVGKAATRNETNIENIQQDLQEIKASQLVIVAKLDGLSGR